jgi:hypothetical protein
MSGLLCSIRNKLDQTLNELKIEIAISLTSSTEAPASAWYIAKAICSRVNMDFLIVKLLKEILPENSDFRLSNLLKTGQIHASSFR